MKKSKRQKKCRKPKTQDEPAVEHADPPAICSHLTIGFNSTIRCLEEVVSFPRILEPPKEQDQNLPVPSETSTCPAVVVMYREAIPSPISESIPLLVAAASVRIEGAEPIRLVELSVSAEAELSAVLGLPRVSMLGLDASAPDAGPLLQYIRDQVEPVHAPWLKQVPSSAYMPVKIASKEVDEGVQKKSRKRKPDAG